SNPSYISLAWNTLFNLMLAYFALSIIETLAISHLKRVHDQEIANLKNLEQKMNEKNSDRTDDDSPTPPMRRSTIGGNYKRERSLGRGYESD
ncbi:11683_t:CDS:1, partial [Gigaspora rosea]